MDSSSVKSVVLVIGVAILGLIIKHEYDQEAESRRIRAAYEREAAEVHEQAVCMAEKASPAAMRAIAAATWGPRPDAVVTGEALLKSTEAALALRSRSAQALGALALACGIDSPSDDRLKRLAEAMPRVNAEMKRIADAATAAKESQEAAQAAAQQAQAAAETRKRVEAVRWVLK